MNSKIIRDTYLITKSIGRGGYSEVYLAVDQKLRRKVAVKRLNLVVLGEKDRQRFLREAHLLARTEHPHVIPIYSLEEEGDDLYIVMQYAERGSLLDLFKASPDGLPIADVVDIGIAMCKALIAVHEQDVIHRDVKPGNILLVTEASVQTPVPKLADFGIARDLLASPLTTPDMPLGTLVYMPPEAIRGREGVVDERRDIYGLGAVLYEALTGRPPLGAEVSEILARLDSGPTSPRQTRADVPEWLDQVILKALAIHRPDRYPTVHQMLVALEQGRRSEQIAPESQSQQRNWLMRYLLTFDTGRVRTIVDQAVANIMANFAWWLIGGIGAALLILIGVTSNSPILSPTATLTPSATSSPTATATLTITPTWTPSLTHTPTPGTATSTRAPTRTIKPVLTPTRAVTRTRTPAATHAVSSTPTSPVPPPPPPEPTSTPTPTNTLVPPEPDTATPTNTLVSP